MNKPILPPSPLPGQSLARPKAADLLKKKPQVPEEELARTGLLPADGVQMAEAGATGTAGGAGGTGTAMGTAGGTTTVGTTGAGGWLTSAWTWVGLGTVGVGAAASSGGGDGGDAAPLGPQAPTVDNIDMVALEDASTYSGTLPGHDANGDTLTYSVVGGMPAGVTVNADGSFSVTPLAADQALDSGETRSFTFQYKANDGTADSNTGTITVTITGANDAPVTAGAATAAGSEDDATISGSVSAATDVDGETLTYSVVGTPPAGLVFNADGTFTYTPQAADAVLDAGETRDVTFQYVASDGTAQSAAATVTITVSGANDAPVSGGAASASGSEDDASITGTVPAASDVDVETLTYVLTAAAPAGLTFNSDGTFSYVPQAADAALDVGESRQVTFQYVANDGTASSAPATVTLTITGANDAPVSGGNVSVSGSEEAASITGNVPVASDVDLETLTYALTAAAPAGLTFNSDGSFSYVPQAADHALDDGETRDITFQYRASDGSVDSNTATVTITVSGANDAPVTSLDSVPAKVGDEIAVNTATAFTQRHCEVASLPDGGFVAVWTTSNFSNDATLLGQRFAADGSKVGGEFQVNTGNSSAQSSISITTVADGFVVSWTSADANGISDEVYARQYDADGNPLAAQFRLNTSAVASQTSPDIVPLADGGFVALWADFNGHSESSATCTLRGQRFDAAGARVDGEFVIDSAAAMSTSTLIRAEATDDGFLLSWGSRSGSTPGVVLGHFTADGMAIGEQQLLATFASGASSSTDLTTLADGSYLVRWTVNGERLAQRLDASGTLLGEPVALESPSQKPVSGFAYALPDGGFICIWTSNDGGGSWDIVGQRFASDLTPIGNLVLFNDNTVGPQWMPAALVLEDGQLLVAWSTPVAGSDDVVAQRFDLSALSDTAVVAITEDGTRIDGRVPAAVDADGDTLTYALVDTAPAGLTFNGDGTFNYVPQAADSGLDDGETRTISFQYVANDGTTNSAPATVAIIVHGSNDAPVLPGSLTGNSGDEDHVLYGSVPPATDIDGETLAYSLVNPGPAGFVFNSDGTYSYTPQSNDNRLDQGQSRNFSFDYVASDGNITTGPATVVIYISGINDAPVASNGTASKSEDSAVTLSLSALDAENDTLTYTMTSPPQAGLTFNSNGTFTYVSQAADNALDSGESRTVTFSFKANDGRLDGNIATYTLTINGANDAPVALTGSVTGSEDAAAIAGSVAATDVDDEPLTYSISGTAPAGLTFNSDGTFSYVPQAADQVADAGETRTVTFSFRAHDGTSFSAPATITINLTGANDAPVANNVAVTGNDNMASITGSANAADVDVETLTYSTFGTVPAGLTFNSDGTFNYVPQAIDQQLDTGESRQVTFQYTASDGTVSSVPATVTLTVNGANDAPEGVAGSATTSEDTSLSGSVSATDVDGEALPLTYSLFSGPSGLTLNSNGSFTYVPQASHQQLDTGESSQVTFIFRPNDGAANGAPTMFTITITGANDAPVASNATASGSEDAVSITGSVSATDVDVEPLTYAISGVTPAGLTFNSNGTFSYVPQAADQVGDTGETRTVTFQYVASDGTASSAPATVTITINGANDAPVASNFAASGSEDALNIVGSVPVATDVDVETLTYALSGAAPAGLTFNSNRSFIYVPQAADQALDTGETRTVTFQYVASDGTATSSAATVTITVNGANDAPVSGGGVAVSGSENDALITGNVPAASDVDGEALSYALTAAAPAGLTFNSDGTFSYVPQAADAALNGGESRTFTFSYVASDGTSTSAPATVTITIVGANNAPVISVAPSTPTEPQALGDEIEVEATSYLNEEPAIAALTDGGFVTIWKHVDLSAGTTYSVRGQRYDAAGEPLGSPFQVNNSAAAGELGVSVVGTDDGGFVAVWANRDTGDTAGVIGQRFAADGSKAGSEFQINTATADWQVLSEMDRLADGGFVVTWTSGGQDGDGSGVYAQRFAADGTAVGTEFQVNTTTAGYQTHPDVTGLADGGFVLAWPSSGTGPADSGIFAQRFAADGSVVGSEFRVSTDMGGMPEDPVITGLADGGFVVAWLSLGQDGSSYGVYAQRFDADGAAVGSEFRINVTTDNAQIISDLVATDDGGFIASWMSPDQDDGGRWGAYMRRYDADGTAIGSEIQIHDNTFGSEQYPAGALLADGTLVMAWSQGDSSSAIVIRHFSPGMAAGSTTVEEDGNLVATGQLLVSDADTGDTHTWSITGDSDYGSMSIAADGTWTFTLDGDAPATIALAEGDSVTETFTATVDDGQGGSDTHTVTITITGANDAPVITAGAAQPAAPQKVGDEFLVNTTTEGEQQAASVAALGDGGYVVTWMSEDQNGSSWGIYAQRYDAGNTPVGDELRVNTTTANQQYYASTVALADGGFVVAWMSDGQDPDGSRGIYAQRFDADGNAAGGEFRVNTYTDGYQSSQSMAALADGGFLIGWSSQHQDGDGWGTYAQRYDADGNTVGSEFLVNTGTTTENQLVNSITGLPDGGFLITWRGSEAADPFYGDLFAQRYDAAGAPVGSAFRVSDPAPQNQTSGDIAVLADGGFVITWTSTEDYSIYAKRYDASGVAIGAEFQVTEPNPDLLRSGGSVTALDDGGFVIAWNSNQEGSLNGVYLQRYAADGTPIGAETLVNTARYGEQSGGSMATLADGSLVVTWMTSEEGYGNFDIHAQRLQPGSLAGDAGVVTEDIATTATGVLVANDLEGDDVTWSISENGYIDPFIGPYGTMAIDADGAWTFTLNAINPYVDALDEGDTLTASFTATATDAYGSSTHTVTVTINGRNDAPTVADVTLSGSADDSAIPIAVDVYDPEGNPVTVYQAFGPSLVPVVPLGDGMGYAPQAEDIALAEGETRTFDFHYVATDGRLFSPTATATITVTGVNDAPDITDAGILNAVGDEFQVNSFTANDQFAPVIKGLADGGFVVVWTSRAQDDIGDVFNDGVYGQRYDADGAPVGGEFRVNQETASYQFAPRVASLTGGGFAVTWTSDGQDGDGYGAYARLYDADGNAVGNEFQVSTVTSGYQVALDCLSLDGGGFAVLWGSDDFVNQAMYLQRYNAAGVADGAPLQLTTTLDGLYFAFVPVTVLADGSFLVLSTATDAENPFNYDLFGSLVSADGSTTSAPFPINSSGYGHGPAVAVLADGSFVVVYASADEMASNPAIYAQLYSADGTSVGDAFQVSPDNASWHEQASVQALPDGGFVVAWAESDGFMGGDIFARRFDATGAPLSDATQINTTEHVSQGMVELGLLADGRLVAAWTSNGPDGDSLGVFARGLETPPLFVDAGAVSENVMETTGTLVVVDPDNGDSGSWSVEDDTPASNYGTLTLAADGSWQYMLDTRSAATKALAAGETVTETFTATFSDTLGLTDTHGIAITITGAEGDYVVGTVDNDVLTGSAGDDIFDGGTGALDTFVESSTASDDVYIYRYGTDGFDDITETTAVSGDDEDVLEIHDAMADMLDFTADGSDLIIDVNGDGSDDIRIQSFFSADQSALDADIEEVVVYSDAGETELASYTSQQIHDQLFP
jgi:VCBS repeat-containing protein